MSDEDEDRPEVIPHQWQWDGKSYTTVGKTKSRLPSGLYQVRPNAYTGDLYFYPTAIPAFFPLHNSLAEKVVEEVSRFWDTGAAYEAYSMPHRRGILIHGPQGTGKSTIVYRVAESVIESGGIAFYGIRGIDTIAGAYNDFRAIDPKRPLLIIIEDLDEFVNGNNLTKVTNFIDGIGAADLTRVMFLATTNHLDDLPDVIRDRPSRFDSIIKIGLPGHDDRLQFAKGIIKIPSERWDPEQVAVDTKDFTLAHIKELFISVVIHEREYDVQLARLRRMMGSAGQESDEDEPEYAEER